MVGPGLLEEPRGVGEGLQRAGHGGEGDDGESHVPFPGGPVLRKRSGYGIILID